MKEQNNIYAVIVLYNKNCKDSITYNCLQGYEGVNNLVCDNSTKDFQNKKIVEENGNIYIDMKGNKGISKAYNASLDKIKGQKGIICFFDDDTDIPESYFKILLKSAENNPADIYMPIVKYEIGILSPCVINNVNVRRPKTMEEINGKNITGINSGMAIGLSIFEDYRYDENYFLDYVDHKFLRDMKEKKKKIKIFDIELKQSFSGNDFSDLKSSLNRFKIYEEDYRRFCSDNFKNRLIGEINIFKRKLKLIYKFRSFKFLK